MDKIKIEQLTEEQFSEAVELVLKAELDTKEEIKHHLNHLEAHYIAKVNNKVVGVIGWYKDNVNYATKAMGDKFPGENAYWVGFFAVDKNYRGQGIGFTLLNKLEKAVKKMGAREIWVSSVPETKDYYLRQGFKLVMTGKINDNYKYFCVKSL